MEKSRFVFQWDEQPMQMCKVLCSLMESQSLVDLTIICNSYTIKVHKCVMAANSSYFRERLQKDAAIDRVVINGLKHPVIKSLIEYIYCGETSISEEYIPELIEAAKFLGILGVSSINSDKLGCQISETITEVNLMNKPPVFFSKNEKSRYYFKEKDMNMVERNIKYMVEGNDYPLYDSSRRRRHSQPKVADGTHIALAKEEAASRQALEMLQKDLNSTGNVFVIDESCTEATVQTDLSSPFENPHVMQIQEYVIENDIKNTGTDLARPPEHTETSNIQISNNLLHKFKGVQFQTKRSPNENNDCQETYEIQGNLPVIYKSADGSYLNVSNQILENLGNSQGIEYHVIPSDGNVDFQQYICNNYDGYSVEIHNSQSDDIVNNFEIVKQDTSNEEKKQLTYTQLVADTVSPDYETSGYESHYPGNVSLVDSISDGATIHIINNVNDQGKISDESFMSNYPLNYSTKSNEKNKEKYVIVATEILPKRKRGRPPKRKLMDLGSDTPLTSSTPTKIDYIFDEKSQNLSQVIELDLSNKNERLSVSETDNNDTMDDKKENDDPFNIYTKKTEFVSVDDNLADELECNKTLDESLQPIMSVSPLNEIVENTVEDNRRQTRSSSKLNFL